MCSGKKTYIKLSKYVEKKSEEKNTPVFLQKSHALEIEDYPLVISYSLLLKMTIVDWPIKNGHVL